MATYYVDFTNGLDANNGLGPDASAATNKPWKTLTKLLGASGMASGDTAYLSPAGPFREVVTVNFTPTATTSIIGDVANAQSFKTSGGVLVTPGDVIWTAFTTSDTAAASGTVLLNLNSKNFLYFDSLVMVGAINATQQHVSGLSGTNITFKRCTFLQSGAWRSCLGTTTYNTNHAWLFDSCIWGPGGHNDALGINVTRGAGADYDAGITLQNCLFHSSTGATAVNLFAAGSGAGLGGGVVVRNCTAYCGGTFVGAPVNTSISIPNLVSNCLTVQGNATALTGATGGGGTLVEDYNVIAAGTVRSNVSIGPFTRTYGSALAMLLEVGQSFASGRAVRPYGMPTVSSPMLGLGNAILVAGRAATVTDDATVGSAAWTTPSNASVPDGTSTTSAAIPATTGITHYLNAQGFTGFAGIPSTATIVSIRVEAIVLASVATGVSCNSVKLLKAGAIVGNNLASSNTTVFTTAAVIHSWGSAADPLWGTTWTVAQVQAAGFGCVWAAQNVNASTRTCSVDFIRVIVAYTTQDGAGGVATDMLGATRPAGGNSTLYAVGALERGNTATVQSTTARSGSAWKITGPGYHDLRCNVDAASVVLGIYARYDTAGQQPTVTLKAAPELGIAADVALTWSDPGANAWAQFTTTTVPTAAGVVTLRLATAANTGISYFDDFSAT